MAKPSETPLRSFITSTLISIAPFKVWFCYNYLGQRKYSVGTTIQSLNNSRGYTITRISNRRPKTSYTPSARVQIPSLHSLPSSNERYTKPAARPGQTLTRYPTFGMASIQLCVAGWHNSSRCHGFTTSSYGLPSSFRRKLPLLPTL
jgi:hypothetical protein